MKCGIVLNKQINCENICTQAQNLINNYAKANSDFSNAILVMEIKNIIDAPDSVIPRIEYMNHNDSPT